MITAINNMAISNQSGNNISKISFKSDEHEQKNEINDLKFMPDFRDVVIKKDYENNGVLGFVENVNKEIAMSQAQMKIDMIQEKLNNLEEGGTKKEILGWMLADAVDEMEKLKLHYNEV